MGKWDANKKLKRDSLLNTSFELFTSQGINQTSISDIVKKAGVAKGTFYLYFKDKYDIRNRLIARKSNQLFAVAYKDLLKENLHTIEDKIKALHQRKRDLADQLLSESDTIKTKALEELLRLLRED